MRKYFSVLGDSISTLDGYNPRGYDVYYKFEKCHKANVFMPEDTWWGQVIGAFGGELLVNDSWSGSMVCRHPKCLIPSYGASDERTGNLGRDGISPDVVMVYIGANDWGAAMRIDPEPGGEESLAFFRVAYRVMLEKIRRNYPSAELWCFTLGVSKCVRNPMFEFPYRYAGRHIEEYNAVIRDCAKEAGCQLIELFPSLVEEPFDTVEGFHPNADGMKTISAVVLRQIAEAGIRP